MTSKDVVGFNNDDEYKWNDIETVWDTEWQLTKDIDNVNNRDVLENTITPNMKKQLMDNVNNMDSEQHYSIFKTILLKKDQSIYSITGDNVLFDINDLSNEEFYKLQSIVNFLEKKKKRELEIELFKSTMTDKITGVGTNISNTSVDVGAIATGSASSASSASINCCVSCGISGCVSCGESDDKLLPTYEQLMINALKKCTYSTYYTDNEDNNNNLLMLKNDMTAQSKKLYSDTYSGNELYHIPTIGPDVYTHTDKEIEELARHLENLPTTRIPTPNNRNNGSKTSISIKRKRLQKSKSTTNTTNTNSETKKKESNVVEKKQQRKRKRK